MSRYLVSGYAFVPVRVEHEVLANDEDEAKNKALLSFKFPHMRSKMIVDGSTDMSAAFDFSPSEAIRTDDDQRINR